jgi:hypothetical protein
VAGSIIGGAESPGCKGAPNEFVTAGQLIKNHVGKWINWYQSKYPHVHSGEFEDADLNIFRDYKEDSSNIGGSHSLIGYDQEVWDEVTNQIRRVVGK